MSKHRRVFFAALALSVGSLTASLALAAELPPGPSGAKPDAGLRRYIYAACPDGSQPSSSGRGIVVLDIDAGCAYVKTIVTPALSERCGGAGGGDGVRGIVGHTATKRLWYTFKGHRWGVAVVGCLDLQTEKPLWEIAIDKDEKSQGHRVGSGNPAITPDGKKLYVPPEWGVGQETTVLHAENGGILAFVDTGGNGCGNAIMSSDGKYVYSSQDATRIETATDRIAWREPGGTAVNEREAAASKKRHVRGPAAGHSHYVLDATGQRMFGTYELRSDAAIIYDAASGRILDRLAFPAQSPLAYFGRGGLWHEGSFGPSGDRFWIMSMDNAFGSLPLPGDDLLAHPQVVDTGGTGSMKIVAEWDLAQTPAALVKAIIIRSPGHSHAHALVTREGDLLLTGNGYALDTATGKIKHAWKDKDGKWFQGTKFMQVNFRDGKVDWVGQRHGTGWLYKVPSLSEAKAKEGNRE